MEIGLVEYGLINTIKFDYFGGQTPQIAENIKYEMHISRIKYGGENNL